MKIKLFAVFISFLFFFSFCNSNPYSQGKRLYSLYCANCHMEDGKGFKMLYPPLAASDYLAENQDLIACIIRYGQQDTIIVNGEIYSLPMLGVKELNDVEITNIINYINTSWGNNLPPSKLETVSEQLAQCKD